MNAASETPLLDLLRMTPESAVGHYEPAPFHSVTTPYGILCHRAATEIQRLRMEVDRVAGALQGARTRYMNLTLDLDRVLNNEQPICSFDVVHRIAMALWEPEALSAPCPSSPADS